MKTGQEKARERKRANEVLRKECERMDSLTSRKGGTISTFKSGQEKVHDLRQDLTGKWPHPTVMDSWVFLVTEVGEVGDALIRQGYGERSAYVRNTPGKSTDLKKELGDVYLMLCTLANHLGISLDEALDEVTVRLREKCRLSHEEVDKVIKRLKEDREYGNPKSE